MTPAAVAQRALTLPGDTLVYIPRIGETTIEELRAILTPGSIELPPPLPLIVTRIVARSFAVRPDHLASKRRTAALMTPRQVAMYVMKEMLGLSLRAIGDEFGGRDHSTVIYSIRKIEALMEESTTFRTVVERISAEVALAMRGRAS